MNYLPLCFSGVLQYFSDNNSIALRQTYNTSLYPTKKAVVGLIAAALGYDRNDSRSKELFDSIQVNYMIVNNPVLLNDFQTIRPLKSQSYYMNKFYNGNKFITMSNSYQDRNLLKHVQYIQDAEFVVYIGAAADELLKTIYEALRNPVYSLYFGKRSCVPNKPIVTEFELLKEEDLKDVFNCA